jgi:hypothetical protein
MCHHILTGLYCGSSTKEVRKYGRKKNKTREEKITNKNGRRQEREINKERKEGKT